jgi:hypothetical protein
MSGPKIRVEKTLDPRDELVIAFKEVFQTREWQNILKLIRAIDKKQPYENIGSNLETYVHARVRRNIAVEEALRDAMNKAMSNMLVPSPSKRKKLKWPKIPSNLAIECWQLVSIQLMAGTTKAKSQFDAAKKVALSPYFAPARLSRRSNKIVEIKIAANTILDHFKDVERARKRDPALAALIDDPHISNSLVNIAKIAPKP